MKKFLLVLITLLSLTVAVRAQDKMLTAKELKIALSSMSDYTPPTVQGVKIEGTVKELEKKFREKDWTNIYDRLFQNFSASELNSLGINQETTPYKDGACIMEGYFLRKKSYLLISPKSKTDLNVASVIIVFTEDEDYVKKFVEYDVMPLIETYSKKYGEYYLEYSERYKGADDYTPKFLYGANHDILEATFNDPSIKIRAFSNENEDLSIAVAYFNMYNYLSQLLKDMEEGDDYINDEI